MTISGKLYLWNKGVKSAPAEAGVYGLYNEDRVLIYIGGSGNLRETFIQYFETDFSDDPRKRETKFYKRISTPNWKERTKRLLNEHFQRHGRLPKLNILEESPKKVARELGFHFYENIDTPLFEEALSLEEFWKAIEKVPVSSINFHQERGDFAKWIRDVLEETQLAERIKKISGTGEDLRKKLLNSARDPDMVNHLQSKTGRQIKNLDETLKPRNK